MINYPASEVLEYRKPTTNDGNFKAQAAQDAYVYDTFFKDNTPEKGVYVEFGARNGELHSNTYFFEHSLHWDGLLIEMLDDMYAKLPNTRPSAKHVQGAICGVAGDRVFLQLARSISGWEGFEDTYNPERLADLKRSGQIMKRIPVKCLLLEDVLRESGLTTVHYMTVDTEGSEAEILEKMPFDQFQIHLVQVECVGQIAGERIVNIMLGHNYTVIEKLWVGEDTTDILFCKDIPGFSCNIPRTYDANRPQPDPDEVIIYYPPNEVLAYQVPIVRESEFQAQAAQDAYVYETFFKSNMPKKGVYVEFGARDGVQHSNTYFFEHSLQWDGLLVEMMDDMFDSLQYTRPSAKHVFGAVCGTAGRRVFLEVDSSMSGWEGFEDTYHPERLAMLRENDLITRRFAVDCLLLENVLRENGLSTVHYMTVDTEGSEGEILEQMPFDEFQIHLVQVECLGQIPGKRIIDIMIGHGYILYEKLRVSDTTTDMLFCKDIPGFSCNTSKLNS